MGRRSEDATNARLIWPSLRVAAAFFCADAGAAFFALVEGVCFLDVWPVKPACNDTRITKREYKNV